jgi:shikimate dehydrogenase
MTRMPYAEVIGDPIGHSKSPLIHKFWLKKLGLDYDYRRKQVKPDDLAAYLASRRRDRDWCGCNVTIPHKKAILAHLDETLPVVDRLGASNCITRRGSNEPRLVGDNTDWSGFLEPMQAWIKPGPIAKFAYVVGTGGAAAAISYALDRADFCVVSIARDTEKALALRRRLDLFDDDLVMPLAALSKGDEEANLPGHWGDRETRIDCLVNATPLGMTGYPPLDVDLGHFPEDLLVYDIVYDPLETQLLRDARRRGMPTVDGLAMLIGQAASAFEIFFVEKAPRQHDEALRALLLS